MLDADPESAFYQRIQTADAVKDELRCITLTSIFCSMENKGFHIVREKKGHVIEYGPLWAGENNKTLKRTVYILKNWFNVIKDNASDWWDKGSGEGGGLAMNDGVITCVNVLRSVFQHYDSKGEKLVSLDDDDLFVLIKPYSEALGKYLGSLSEEERKRYRELRGVQGQTTRTRRCQQAIRGSIPIFNPPGLDEFLKQEKLQTNIKGKEIIDRIEGTMQCVILDELRREYGNSESEWWILGVPKNVRIDVTKRYEDDDGKRGLKEYYFNLIDYRKIILQNWSTFESLFGYGNVGNKEKRTSWIYYINEKRNFISHPSSGSSLSIEVLSVLQEYDIWLNKQINSLDPSDENKIKT